MSFQRRSCVCGAGLTVAGEAHEANAELLADWDRAHAGPGHGPSTRPLSAEGRAGPKPRGERKAVRG